MMNLLKESKKLGGTLKLTVNSDTPKNNAPWSSLILWQKDT